jgi:hypothetical protein
MLKGLVLSGTYTSGTRRAALINGRLWEQGERMTFSKSTAKPWVLARVLPDRVLVESDGKTLELNYPGPESKAATPNTDQGADSLLNKRAIPGVLSRTPPQSAPQRTAPATKAKPSSSR